MRTSPLAFLLLALVGCGSSGASPTPDAGKTGSTPGTTVGTCAPSPGFEGNSKNVGAYCTESGGQCSSYPNGPALLCAADVAPAGCTKGIFCLVLCSTDSDCGEGACCAGESPTSPKACVPNGCFDAGICTPVAQGCGL